jgi:ACS family hexuronate transporter-like MFS transporter
LLAQPLGHLTYWIPVIIIGIAGAAHQAWSANLFSTVGDMFPKSAIATVTGIGGMAGGVGAFLINKGSGMLFDFTQKAWSTIGGVPLLDKYPQIGTSCGLQAFLTQQAHVLGVDKLNSLDDFLFYTAQSGQHVFNGISTGYMIIFSICAVAYLIGWLIMKLLVPRYKPIVLE